MLRAACIVRPCCRSRLLSLARVPVFGSPAVQPHRSGASAPQGQARLVVVRAMSTPQSRAELFATPGVAATQDSATKDFIMQQTMFRIKEPTRSLKFYTEVLGMRLLTKLDFPDAKFSLYFVGYEASEDVPDDPKERTAWLWTRKATIELTHNWGTESDPNFKGYHSGNSEPKGFGHIGLAVPDVYAACKRFEELGVEFQKRPDEGSMKGLAFIKDPDGYWIEILASHKNSI